MFVCLFTVLRLAQEFFTYAETSQIPVKRVHNLGLCSEPLSREGSLSRHTCSDTGTRFFQSHPKGRHSVASYDTEGDAEDLFLLRPFLISCFWFPLKVTQSKIFIRIVPKKKRGSGASPIRVISSLQAKVLILVYSYLHLGVKRSECNAIGRMSFKFDDIII